MAVKFLIVLVVIISHPQSRAADTSGNATTRIVGGVETGVNEFPMMSALVNLRSRAVHCGATISKSGFFWSVRCSSN